MIEPVICGPEPFPAMIDLNGKPVPNPTLLRLSRRRDGAVAGNGP